MGICCVYDFMLNNLFVNKNWEILFFIFGFVLFFLLLRLYNNCKYKIVVLDVFDVYDNLKINCLVCLR